MAFELTDEQNEVVSSFGAPLRVLAGPGTGKTLCLVERVKFLINKKKIHHGNIFVITFTKRAAGELRNRLQTSGIKSDQLPYVSTLHSLAVSTLKKYQHKAGLPANFRPIDNVFARILLKDTVHALLMEKIRLSPSEVREFNHAHLQNKAAAGLPYHISSDAKKKKILASFSKHFHEQLRFYNAVDWNDVIHGVLELIESHEEVREEVHAQVKYLLVDEYQDLSPLEQVFVKQLMNDHSGLCVVGDDDQSIYETFRFAAPQGIIDFDKEHPKAVSKVISLCRRCPPKIIEVALKLIQNNTQRASKRLEAFDKNKKGFVLLLSHKSKKAEIAWLVSKVKQLLSTQKFNFKDFMVLFTDGAVAKDYIIELEKENIPLDIQLKVSHIFESEVFVGFFSVLKLLIDPSDNLNARHSMNFWRGIGPETVRQLKDLVASAKSDFWRAIDKVADNQNAFKEIRQRKVVLAFRDFIEELRGLKSPTRIVDRMAVRFSETMSDRGIQALTKQVKDFSSAEEVTTLQEIIEDFEQKMDSGELESDNLEVDKVRIMTMHSAKGCESPIVIIPALEDDIIPGNVENVEEKRRLFYVSVTRTKYALFLSWASQRSGPEIHKVEGRKIIGKTKSRFLTEIGQPP
jgi:DNA helicase-2/ATP-dependent DNA helicase PcrA